MQAGSDRELDWRLLVLVFLLAVALLAGRTLFNAATIPLFTDTDDAMRLVVVRDLLAGQDWYDHLQHRLNTPFGAELHWSRFADVPVAALILLFRPFVGPLAEILAAWIWPLLLLLPLLYFTARVALRLVGRGALLPALLLPVFSLVTLGEFSPGRIDHHGLQIVLLLVMVWYSLDALTRPGAAIGAGIAAATGLAIGIEALPAVAATILAFGLVWGWRPGNAAMLRNFGVSFALATAAHLALALPPARWLEPACDALSLTYAAAVLGVGVVFIGLSLLPLAQRAPWLRLALGGLAGILLLGLLALAFPLCLGGPYAALDPWLRAHWIDRITEAMPLSVSFLGDPAYAIAIAAPPLLALGVVGWRLRDSDNREGWLVYGAFLLLAVVVMLLQVRGARMAASLAAPAGAWLILAARQRYLARPNVRHAAALLGAWIAFSGLALLIIVHGALMVLPGSEGVAGTAAASPDRRQCVAPDAFADLAGVPHEAIMAPIDLGSHLLAFTPHTVVAAPYHRNQRGLRDAFAFFSGPITEARAIVEQRDIGLVVICEALPELVPGPETAPDSFAGLNAADALPDWLVEQSPPGAPLRVFAVLP